MQNAGLPLCELRNYVLQVEGTQGTWYNIYQAQALKEYEYLRKPMSSAYGGLPQSLLGYRILSLRKLSSDLVVTDLV